MVPINLLITSLLELFPRIQCDNTKKKPKHVVYLRELILPESRTLNSMDVNTHRTGDPYPTIYIPASEQATSKKN